MNLFIDEFKAYIMDRMRKEWSISEEEFNWFFDSYFFYSGKFFLLKLILNGFKNLESDELVAALYDRFEKMVEDVNRKSSPDMKKHFKPHMIDG